MKPRSKKDREIAELSSRLPQISDKMIDWGKDHCFEHKAFVCKGEAWCSECGKSWVITEWNEDNTVVCPYCGKKLKIQKSRKQKHEEVGYMTICRSFGGYQLLRHVYLYKFIRKDGEAPHFFASEVVQQWFNEKGDVGVMAKPLNMNRTGWYYSHELSFKYRGTYDFYGMEYYDIHGDVYPKTSFIPLLRRNGLKTSFHGLNPPMLIKYLLKNEDMIETLFKTKQYGLIQYRMTHGGGISWFKNTINICNRNHYIVKDGSMYSDYMYLLRYFHLDMRNAHYVCPKDLKKAHDMLQKRKDRKEAERRRKYEMLEAIRRKDKLKKDIRYFTEHIIPYIGLMFQKDGISIRPLYSVSAFYKEAKVMHHCVWSNEYYTHKDCLILSAQKDGERLETIEVNLKTYKIVQSRAVCNGTSDYHNQIVDLVNKNMNLIRQCA